MPSRLVFKRTICVALIATALSMLIWTGFRVMTGIHPDVKTNTIRILIPSLIAVPIGFFWFSRLERLENAYRNAVRYANEMTRIASVDPLTGLLNRRSFIAYFEAATATGIDGWFLLADIDYLKKINDKYGHHTGDDAILAVSYALIKELPLDSLIGRIGGDEFCAFVPKVSQMDIKRAVAAMDAGATEKLHEKHPAIKQNLSLSVGYMLCEPDQKFAEIMALTDEQMYRRKRQRG